MNGAHDEAAGTVQEVALLPVHLGRHMNTTVQVGDHRAFVAKGKRAGGPPVFFHVKDAGLAAILEF